MQPDPVTRHGHQPRGPLKAAVEGVLDGFDHKHLNLDTPWFADRQPTTENLAAVRDLIAGALSGATLSRLRLYEANESSISDDRMTAPVVHLSRR